MRLLSPLPLGIALRYALSHKAHKFAFFVAVMSALGIAIGVCALITVSAVMQGLQDRLKGAVLDTTAHVVVEVKDADTIHKLAALPEVIAMMPYLEGEVLLQSSSGLKLALLQGYDPTGLVLTRPEMVKDRKADSAAATETQFKSALPLPPAAGSYALIAPQSFMLESLLSYGAKVRLISTKNARYTPLGLTPTQRLFTIESSAVLPQPHGGLTLIANLEDVKRLLRERSDYVRLFLSDPFLIDELIPKLEAMNLNFTDWRASQGDFFKAVALEKLSMSVMLCLIILVASFNILAALTMLVSARVREIAVLKSLGCTSRRILQIFMLQGLICAGAGVIAGTALGIPLTLNVQTLLALFGIQIVQGELPVALNLSQIVFTALGCLLLAALCTLYPALKASRCDPAVHLTEL